MAVYYSLLYVCDNCKAYHHHVEDVQIYDDPVIQLPDGWAEDDAKLLCHACAVVHRLEKEPA